MREDLLIGYVNYCRTIGGMAKSTMVNVKSNVSEFLRWADANWIGIDRVTEEEFGKFLESLNNRGQTKRMKVKRLKGFFVWLQDQRIIQDIPIPSKLRIKESAPKVERKGLSQREVEKILEATEAMSDREKFVAIYCLSRPIRVSELAGIKVGDVNLRSKTIRIGFNGDHDLKTVGSNRIHKIPKTLVEVVKRLVAGRPDDAPLLGVGTEMAKVLVRKIFDLAKVQANGRGSHSLRHTVIERMIFKQKVDPMIVAKLAGNKVQTIYKHYLTGVPESELNSAQEAADVG